MTCIYEMERVVNQVLWYSVFSGKYDYGSNGLDFENDTFEIKCYRYDAEDDDVNDYHFYHKPSGLKISWYKYPLRDPMSNMEITHEQFLTVLRDCFNSFKTNVSYGIKPWWSNNEETK